LPPAEVQAELEALLTQPWPLQLFWPLHSLVAALHSEVPLQLLTPEHFTLPASAILAVGEDVQPAANSVAAAAATMAPDFKVNMGNSSVRDCMTDPARGGPAERTGNFPEELGRACLGGLTVFS
jgi:hypothetical protein